MAAGESFAAGTYIGAGGKTLAPRAVAGAAMVHSGPIVGWSTLWISLESAGPQCRPQ